MSRLWVDLDNKPGGLLLARHSQETSPGLRPAEKAIREND